MPPWVATTCYSFSTWTAARRTLSSTFLGKGGVRLLADSISVRRAEVCKNLCGGGLSIVVQQLDLSLVAMAFASGCAM